MDSTNNFHHQQEQHQQQEHLLQDHFVGCSPLITSHPSSHGFGVSTSSLHWNNNILSRTTTSTDTFCNKLYENNESNYHPHNLPCNNNNSNFPKIEEDMLSSFSSFTALINNNPTNMIQNSCSFNNFIVNNNSDNNSNNTQNNNFRGLMNFPLENQEQIHQTSYSDTIPINNWITSTSNGFHSSSNILHQLGLVSSPNSTSVSSSSPRLGLNMQAMDLLGNNASYGSHGLHEEAFVPSRKNNTSKAMGLTNGIAGTKRAATGSCSSDQSKAASTSNTTTTTPNKKSQLKTSCPPLKVRKEKLGDRIASLHQLVSPFGKTDTASVLTEAIGYIQFLQDQIHTLCMPSAKPSRNRLCRPLQMTQGNEEDDVKDDDLQIDIRRRGLCLVPVSWTSYINTNQFDASNTSYF